MKIKINSDPCSVSKAYLGTINVEGTDYDFCVEQQVWLDKIGKNTTIDILSAVSDEMEALLIETIDRWISNNSIF